MRRLPLIANRRAYEAGVTASLCLFAALLVLLLAKAIEWAS